MDFFSFYSVPSTVIRSTKHPTYEAAHLFYYGSETAFVEGTENDGQLKDRLATLIGNAIVIARAAEFDVFSVLTLMDNVSVLQDLKVCINFFWLLVERRLKNSYFSLKPVMPF